MEEALTRLEIQAPEEAYETITGLLALMLSMGWEEESLTSGETRFRVHCANQDLVRNIMEAVHAAVPAAVCLTSQVVVPDWRNAWKEFFTPVTCGSRFVVLPPWLAGDAARDFPGRQAVIIEPRSAFGTGHHATTALCLTVLSDLLDLGVLRAGQIFLDLGTGSGVLGLGLALSGLAGEGLDIDPLALDNVRENLVANGVAEDRFTAGLGSVDKVAGRSFDVVVANILSGPLIDMAAQLSATVHEGGALVLSGILDVQADSVARAYAACGLGEPERLTSAEWVCLYWKDAWTEKADKA